MLIGVLINNLGGACVVWRVNINAPDLLTIPLLYQIKRMEILTFNQQAVCLLVQILKAC